MRHVWHTKFYLKNSKETVHLEDLQALEGNVKINLTETAYKSRDTIQLAQDWSLW
jgi:hypothetical protein